MSTAEFDSVKNKTPIKDCDLEVGTIAPSIASSKPCCQLLYTVLAYTDGDTPHSNEAKH